MAPELGLKQWRRPCQVKGGWSEKGHSKLRHLLRGIEGQGSDWEAWHPKDSCCSSTPAAPWRDPFTLPTEVVMAPRPLIHPAGESRPIRQNRQPHTFGSMWRQPPPHPPALMSASVPLQEEEKWRMPFDRFWEWYRFQQWYSYYQREDWVSGSGEMENLQINSRVLLMSTHEAHLRDSQNKCKGC